MGGLDTSLLPGKTGPIPGGSSANLDPFSDELEGNQIPAYTNWNQGMDSIKKYIQKQFKTMDKTTYQIHLPGAEVQKFQDKRATTSTSRTV